VAGFDPDRLITDADMTIVRTVLETNLIGPWQVCNAFLPLLRQSPHPRIVNVSSGAGLFSEAGLQHPFLTGVLPAYSVSKSALNAYTLKLADALRKDRVLVNAVDPGQTATHPETGDEADARPASESAKGIVWAATLPDDGPTGVFFRDGVPLGW
jgi:NAD(P)-dependent dehydrogenase (short-subunit alcohol dehydrogenase family)